MWIGDFEERIPKRLEVCNEAAETEMVEAEKLIVRRESDEIFRIEHQPKKP